MNFKPWYIVLMGIMLCSGFATGATIPTGITVRQVTFAGGQSVPANALPTLNTKVGLKLNDSMLMQDINTLYLTGWFQKITATPVISSGSATVQFVLEAYPTINQVEWVGNTAFSAKQLNQILSIRPGEPINTRDIAKSKASIETFYIDNGFDLAQVLEITVSPSRNVIIELTEGQIKDIDINGLPPALMPIGLREIKSSKGGYFNSKRLRDDRERLLRLGYFSDVMPPRLGESLDKTQVTVVFDTTPRKLNTLDAGIEYYEQSGEQPLTGFIRTELHHTIIPSDVLSLKLQGAHSEKLYIQGYSGRYSQPWFLNQSPLSFSIGAWSERFNEFLTKDRNNADRLIFSNQRQGADLALSYPILDDLRLSTRYKHEDVEPDTTSGLSAYAIRSIAFKAEHQTVKNMANPKNGVYAVISHELGGDIGIANMGGITFQRTIASVAGYTETSKMGVFAAKFTIGEFRPGSNSSSAFESEGFDIGGPSTLRGYKESFPAFIGNREMLLNTEYRHDLGMGLSGVLFWDFGRAFYDDWSTDFSGFKSGVGVGLRYMTPMGAIRLDAAMGETLLIHFGLGHTF